MQSVNCHRWDWKGVTDGANTVVLDQLPPAGAKLVKGGHVMLYTAGSEELTPEELVCVPDLTGLGDVDCARLVRQRGLMMSMTGQGLCTEQSPGSGKICHSPAQRFFC